MQKLVGLATGGIGGAGIIPSIAPGAFDLPPAPIASTGRNNPSIAPGAFDLPPAPIASTGRNNLSNININNQQNELMMSIDGLKREIASSREQNFNLYLDGLPLRNAIKRVEKNLNIMGS